MADDVRIRSSDGVALALHDLGGDGPPLLLLHATGFCGRAYEALGAALATAFHVRALDFRGHGDSTAPEGGRFDWGAVTDDFLAAAAALGEGPVAVFGHSLGGAVALLAAARAPDVLRAAYLYEPVVVPGDPAEWYGPNALAEAALRRRAEFPSRAEAFWRYARRPPLDTLQAGALAAYVEHGFVDIASGDGDGDGGGDGGGGDGGGGGVRLKCTPEHEAATFAAAGKPGVAGLGAIDLTAVVGAGELSVAVGPGAVAPAIADALPRGRLELHPSLGHLGPLENPHAVAERALAGLVTPPR